MPDGVLFGSSKAHKELRRILVEDQKLDAVVKLPPGVQAVRGVSTAILFFTKTNSGGTDDVWFYDVQADGFSPRRQAHSAARRGQARAGAGGARPRTSTRRTTCPTCCARWAERDGSELERARTEQSFCVPKEDIAAQGYDLSLNRYKEIVHEEVEHRAPGEILDELERIEKEIGDGMAQLREMLTGGAE